MGRRVVCCSGGSYGKGYMLGREFVDGIDSLLGIAEILRLGKRCLFVLDRHCSRRDHKNMRLL